MLVFFFLGFFFFLQNPICATQDQDNEQIQKAFDSVGIDEALAHLNIDEDQLHLKTLEDFAEEDGKHNPLAQYYLGILYEEGKGVEKNLLTAAQYYYDCACDDPKLRQQALKRLLRCANDCEKSRSFFTQEESDYVNKNPQDFEKSWSEIALFRGIHYVNNLFKKEEIAQEVEQGGNAGIFLVSSAACKLTGREFLSSPPGLEELKSGKIVRKILKKFKLEKNELYCKFHETYTNDHERFHAALKDPSCSELQNIFQEYRLIFQRYTSEVYPETWTEAMKRNPFVSFSCNADHALRYALGEKSFTGGEDVKLRPGYNSSSAPTNQHLGRLYIATFSPADLWKLIPTFVIDKHAQNKMKISTHNQNNILSEDEVSFLGYLPEGFVKISEVVKAPEFSVAVTDESVIRRLLFEQPLKYESKAYSIIANSLKIRIWPEIFENYYSHISDSSRRSLVSSWIHSVNEGNAVIAVSPVKGKTPVDHDVVSLFTNTLRRSPYGLGANWAAALKRFSISFYSLNGAGAIFKSLVESRNLGLEELMIKDCELSSFDLGAIAEGLPNNKYLLKLILDYNDVDNSAATKFSAALKSNKTLTTLSLHGNSPLVNIQCFTDLFPSGGEDHALNRSLVELNLNVDRKKLSKALKIIQKGLNRNRCKS